MRFSHFTPWIDGLGFGYSIFDQSQYNPELRRLAHVLRI